MDSGRTFGDYEEVKLRELGQCWGKLASDIKNDGNVVSILWLIILINHQRQLPWKKGTVFGVITRWTLSPDPCYRGICIYYTTFQVQLSVFCFPTWYFAYLLLYQLLPGIVKWTRGCKSAFGSFIWWNLDNRCVGTSVSYLMVGQVSGNIDLKWWQFYPFLSCMVCSSKWGHH